MGNLCFWLFAEWNKDRKLLNLKEMIWHVKKGEKNGQIKQGPEMLNFWGLKTWDQGGGPLELPPPRPSILTCPAF